MNTPLTRITEHFFLHEFDQPARHGEPHIPYPAEWIDDRLRPLCEALEVLRNACGDKPVTVISGYRSPAYNAKVGGEIHSQHLLGKAADIVIRGVTPQVVQAMALRMHSHGRMRIGGLGSYEQFTHIDVREPKAGLNVLARWTGDRSAAKTSGEA